MRTAAIGAMQTLAARSALAACAAALTVGAGTAAAQTIKIGEINSYKAQPAFLEPYRKGMELAIEEVNAAGGVNGQHIEVISRDDGASPGDAVRAAEELLSSEHVQLIAGGFLSNIGLALTDFAQQKKVVYIASEPLTDKIVWQDGNRYTFRLRPSTFMQVAMLAPAAIKMNKKRWALVYPNYEYGQSAAASFKSLIKQAQPDVEFVAEQATPLGHIEAGAVVQALADAKPDAIFNVLFGADLAKFVREGNTRELFKDRAVVSLLTGEPEYIDPLKDEAPAGWVVTGYPWYAIHTAEHDAFLAAYQKKYNDYPRLGSVVGYSTIKAIAAGIRKAGGTDTEKLVAAFRGVTFETPLGPVQFRPQDQQSTMGAYVGRTAVENGKGVMKDFVFIDGSRVQPSDETVKRLRPAEAQR
jgi:branched-chain amino acid transport system substrate-binding protein